MSGVEGILDSLMDLTGSDPVTFLTRQTAAAIRRERLQQAAAKLQGKMARGRPWAFRDDEVASLVFDFLKAAENGAAARNLDMMAELIARGVTEPGLTEETLRHLMKIVAELSYDELRALAALIRAEKAAPPGDEDRERLLYQIAWRDLAGEGAERPDNQTYAAFGALQRTGLVIPGITFGGVVFNPSPLLTRLASLIEFRAADI